MSLDFHTVLQAGIGVSVTLNAWFLRRVAKQIDKIEVIGVKVEVLTEALKNAEGTIKGAIKKVRILENHLHNHSAQMAKLQADVDWLKEAR